MIGNATTLNAAKDMKESGRNGLQALVERALSVRNIEFHHQRISRQSRRGWPDLVIVLDDIIFVELKRQKTRPGPDQVRWMDLLSERHHPVFLWRPIHWLNGTIDRVLENGTAKGDDVGRWVCGEGVQGDRFSLPIRKGD